MEPRSALIASQSDAVRNIAGFALGKYRGIDIRKADNAGDASQQLEENHPDLLIVDASMDRAAALLSTGASWGTATIAINDCGDPMIRAAACVPAPFQPSALQEAIESMPQHV